MHHAPVAAPIAADDSTEVPELAPDLQDPGADDLGESSSSVRVTRRRRREQAAGGPPDDPAASPMDDPVGERVTEAQVVRTFYWLYRGWCKLLGAEVDAKKSDFEDLGRAWVDLMRKVPGIRWIVTLAGPLFTLTDLVDKMATAWSVRTRLRGTFKAPNWRHRGQAGQEKQPEVHVVDGSAGAP